MALYLPGMTCALCERAMQAWDAMTLFPPFVTNERDPLWLFHDGAFHAACVQRHPLGEAARAASEVLVARRARGERAPSMAHVHTGLLTSDPSDPLFPYNHVYVSPRDPAVIPFAELLAEALRSGRASGAGLEQLSRELTAASHVPR